MTTTIQTEIEKNLQRIDGLIAISREKIKQDIELIQKESERLSQLIAEDIKNASRVGSLIHYRNESINEELQKIQILKVERDYAMWLLKDWWEKDQESKQG